MTGAALAETHTAVVVACGDRVYKVKKPVRFPFVDLSTPELRRAACEQEVALNRRLSPDVYLGVATLSGPRDDEPVVVMRRMPEDRRLAGLVAAHRNDAETQCVAVARVMAAFHAKAPTSSTIAAAASPDAVLAGALRNLDELARCSVISGDEIAEARHLTTRYVEGRRPLLAERAALGHARDGHGDLLAGDIFCLPDGPRILDCLEFDPALRYGDVLADVAFLAMDLEHLGGGYLARSFLDAYAEFSGSSWPASLEHFYVAQRALVRAKVACLRGDDQLAEAHRLMRLALRHLRAARCRLILVGGSPGTGKSTLSQGLADRFGLTLLRSDAVRKQMAGIPMTTWHPEAYGKGLYDADHTVATYAELLRRAAIALAHGESIVLDATWLYPAARERAARIAAGTQSDLVELRCVAPVPVARERVLRKAMTRTDISDATPEVAQRMAEEAPPWPAAFEIDTTKPPEAALAVAAERLT